MEDILSSTTFCNQLAGILIKYYVKAAFQAYTAKVEIIIHEYIQCAYLYTYIYTKVPPYLNALLPFRGLYARKPL